jgi:hypothetical protein
MMTVPVQGEIKFTKANIKKILEGTKTATSRTFELADGVYHIKGTEHYVKLTGRYYESVHSMIRPISWTQAEGFKDWDDMYKNCAFEHTREFMRGSRGLWVYRVKLVK